MHAEKKNSVSHVVNLWFVTFLCTVTKNIWRKQPEEYSFKKKGYDIEKLMTLLNIKGIKTGLKVLFNILQNS